MTPNEQSIESLHTLLSEETARVEDLRVELDKVTKERDAARERCEEMLGDYDRGTAWGKHSQREASRRLINLMVADISKHLAAKGLMDRYHDLISGYGNVQMYLDGKFNDLLKAHMEPDTLEANS